MRFRVAREPRSTYRFDPGRVPSIGGNVSSLRDVLSLPPGLADPSYAGRGERTADVMRPRGFDQCEAPGFHGCRPPYLPLGSRPDVLASQHVEAVGRERRRVVADNTVFHEGGRDSRVSGDRSNT